ncbi:MAG: DNA-binding domain-containing protein [Planctomycetes bacterium]|nr:DNA-binding domain-containing protein [Planctomycetota bacterium]MCH9727687.1 DNA-binding domain-containing protein [Planctomycetota bacterium]MCH9775112.1 DNA-binding domain-containing protein [Planctomycetota bacterium]MCH9790342.1 DNA-binding domain-containing protein [Planctomycetota bacterium]
MSNESRNLDQLQRWMQTVISWPGGVEAGIDSEAAQSEIPLESSELETIVTASSRQTSLERMGIYANAYYARLLECLSEEYSALVSAMGKTAFGAFSMEYLQEYHPTSYTLCDLGAHFPQFLTEHKPPAEENELNWTDFLIEVATLERVYSEVFDGPGIEQETLLTAEVLNSIQPEEWPEVTLKMAPCFRLMQFQFPVHEFISHVRKGNSPQIPEQQLTCLAITRRNYVVRREVVSQAEYLLLSKLQQGLNVGDAITCLAESDLMEPEELGTKLHKWFKHWTTAAFFIDVSKQ